MGKLRAKLRVCASCEWIFSISDAKKGDCPKCGFGHYGARYVYGNKCYRYKRTQEPWLERKLDAYRVILLDEIHGSIKARPSDVVRLYIKNMLKSDDLEL
jgi:hypothetical protein